MVCCRTVDSRYRATVHGFAGLWSWPWVLRFAVSSWVSLLSVRLRQWVPRDSSWLPHHRVTSCTLTTQWCGPNGLRLCSNLCLVAERPLPASLCCPGAHLAAWLLTWLIAAWLPGSPPQCPLFGLINSPGNSLLPSSWYKDSLSAEHISCHYKWISVPQLWAPSYSFKNWQLFKPDLEPAGWVGFYYLFSKRTWNPVDTLINIFLKVSQGKHFLACPYWLCHLGPVPKLFL